MKLIPAIAAPASLLCSALLGFGQLVQAHECTVAGAAGSYGCTSSGTIVSPAIGPFTAVGHATFTVYGTLTGAQTTSIAGNHVDETVQGTFTVNPDCSGTLTVFVYHGSTLARTSKLNMVWDNNQKEARGIFLTPGTNISILGYRILDED